MWFYNMYNLQSITGLNYLNTSEVTNMSYMFFYNLGLTSLDLSSFNTSKVTNMGYMFENCPNLRTIYVGSGWNTAAVTESDYMFYYCNSLEGGQGTTYDQSHVDKTYARIDGNGGPGYFTDIHAPRPYACYTPSNTTLSFYYDNQRNTRTGTTYDLNTGKNATGWDTDGTKSSVTKVVFDPSFAEVRPTTTYRWFYNMTNLQAIEGICNLNTSEVTNMFGMFAVCKKLTVLDLSGFNTAQVTDMGAMFWKCSELQTIYVGDGWSTAAVTGSSKMFEDCTKLKGGQGTTIQGRATDKTYAHIDGEGGPGYFTARTTGIATDLHQVTSDKQQVQSDEWYTIDGRKLNGMPAKKGVYIQNGQKRIIK
jgi:surface protein